jgi:hypothetical protein
MYTPDIDHPSHKIVQQMKQAVDHPMCRPVQQMNCLPIRKGYQQQQTQHNSINLLAFSSSGTVQGIEHPAPHPS